MTPEDWQEAKRIIRWYGFPAWTLIFTIIAIRIDLTPIVG